MRVLACAGRLCCPIISFRCLLAENRIILDTQALMLYQLGRRGEALEVIERAIAIHPDWQTAWATKELIRSDMNGIR